MLPPTVVATSPPIVGGAGGVQGCKGREEKHRVAADRVDAADEVELRDRHAVPILSQSSDVLGECRSLLRKTMPGDHRGGSSAVSIGVPAEEVDPVAEEGAPGARNGGARLGARGRRRSPWTGRAGCRACRPWKAKAAHGAGGPVAEAIGEGHDCPRRANTDVLVGVGGEEPDVLEVARQRARPVSPPSS